MIGYQDKINQILRGAETIKNMNDDIDLELSVSVLTKTLKDVQLERDALWVKTQEDERIINELRDAVNQKLIQRTELLTIAEEIVEVIIGNGASVKDAVPIDKLDEFYKKWSIGEPFVRDYKA
jgi:hypothetical protein